MPLRLSITAAKTVSRARVAACIGAAHHQRDDQRHLDHRDRDGQDQRAERVADAVGDHLRVVHGGEDRADEEDRDGGDPDRPVGVGDPGDRQAPPGAAGGTQRSSSGSRLRP